MDTEIRLKKAGIILLKIFLLIGSLCQYPIAKAAPQGVEISTGERIMIEKRSFSIIPPAGWEILLNYPNLSLLLQVPKSKNMDYQRTIQVMAMNGPAYMDDTSAKEFAELLQNHYAKMNSQMSDFSVRDSQKIELSDGRPALFFYTDFTMAQKKFMQAHMLASTEDRHYVVSFTDLAAHFEGKDNHFNEAWGTLVSLQLTGDTPVRFQSFINFGIMAGIILFSLVAFGVGRSYFARRTYVKQADSLNDEDDEGLPSSGISSHSQIMKAQSNTVITPLDSSLKSSYPPYSNEDEAEKSEEASRDPDVWK